MKQENKELLLKDLCARLPYGVKAYIRNWSKLDKKYYEGIYTVKSVFPSLNEVHAQSETGSVDVILGYTDYFIKPYLFPLSSMTEEQKTSHNFLKHSAYANPIKLVDWYDKNHFDYRGLIPMDLSIDATGLNVY